MGGAAKGVNAHLSYFDDFTLRKGRDYYRRGHVQSVSARNGEVEGLITGSAERTYRSEITFKNERIISARCSCPMIRDCKHTAALVLAYLQSASASANRPPAYGYPSIRCPSSDAVTKLPLVREDESGESCEPEAADLLKGLSLLAHLVEKQETPGTEAPASARTRIVYVFESVPTAGITLWTVNARKDGSTAAPKQIRFEQLTYRAPACATEDDIEIANLWWTISGPRLYREDTLQEADPDLLSILVQRILATGRAYFQSLQNPALQPGPPLPARLAWEPATIDKVRLCVVADESEKQYPCLRWAVPFYVDLEAWRCGPAQLSISKPVLSAAYALPDISAEQAAHLPALLAEFGLAELVPSPPGQHVIQVKLVQPQPMLRIESVLETRGIEQRTRIAVLSFQLPHITGEVMSDCDGQLFVERLDPRGESKCMLTMRELGFQSFFGDCSIKKGEYAFCYTDESQWVDFIAVHVHALRAEGWQIDHDTERMLRTVQLCESDLEIKIAELDSWWFSLDLNVEIDGKEIPLLPVLMGVIRQLPKDEAIADAFDSLNRNGIFYAFLADGRLISLPFDRIRAFVIALQEILQRSHKEKEVKVSAPEAADLLLAEALKNARWKGARRIIEFAEKLKKLESVPEIPQPKTLRAELRPYQRSGLNWLQFLADQQLGGVLADDMGLGKTVQVLAHLCHEKENGKLDQPFLVVCPKSVLPNWVAEARRFAPSFRALAFYGEDRSALLADLANCDLVFTTYSVICKDVEKLHWIQWHGVALDEAQVVKNAATKTAKAVKQLRSGYRFCLTGTPVENHPGELWSQFDFVLPGLLGDSATFNYSFRIPIEKGDRRKASILAARIRPFLLRRTKQEVMAELPEKTVILRLVELEKSQRDLYESVRLSVLSTVQDQIAMRGFKQSSIVFMDALLKLRQVCCDPRLVKLAGAERVKESAKLDALKHMLQQLIADGRRILLFSQFTGMLDLIKEELERLAIPYVELRGATEDREEPVRRFQNHEVPLFLISLRAGGTGLNLTAADVVIHYDLWWNPAVENQATDRAHRIGQDKHVFVYKLIARGTVEERMLELQEKKRALAQKIYDLQGTPDFTFSESDVEALLAPLE